MKIDCVSDLHGFKPKLNGGDLLIVGGDLTAHDMIAEHLAFSGWLCKLPYKKIILIAGNHDGKMDNFKPFDQDNVCYLQDSGTQFKGFKIWGSPWTPTFFDWHFMKDRGEDIKKMWDLIPDDIDILVTHGPPFGIQDQMPDPEKFCGCEELRNTLSRLTKLKLHVFGHVHEGYGKVVVNGVIHVNASIMNEHYQPVNKPIRIEL